MIKRDIHISIVSHGQVQMLEQILKDLDKLASKHRFYVLVTFNIPENHMLDTNGFSFPIQYIENAFPKGFGENHNQAFIRSMETSSSRSFFFVVNPDVRIAEDVFENLSAALEQHQDFGVVAPVVVNQNHELEDSVRELPSLTILVKKLLGRYECMQTVPCTKNFCFPDWVAGMFLGFRVETYQALSGFDEKYFLYYEDVDICSRVWLMRKKVAVVQGCSVVHHAQRASHRNLKYLSWHIQSIAQFLLSSVYRQVSRFHQGRRSK